VLNRSQAASLIGLEMERKLTEPAARSPYLAFRHVSMDIGGRRILQNISFEAAKGEFICLVGPSGCGKTTLLRIAAGLLQPTVGQAEFDGRPLLRTRRDVAVVFQDYGRALLPWRTAEGNISLALENTGLSPMAIQKRVADLLSLIGLGRHAKSYPGQLSGGMQQRLQIARCLAQDPVVLLMDEPFGALDAITRQGLQDEILRIIAQKGITVLFVTHDLEEAIYLGDRVVSLQANPGRIHTSFVVDLPKPRDQLSTRENPKFLHLRRDLFELIKEETP
jgi:NitT/TauT family transport system ATP-binding protein